MPAYLLGTQALIDASRNEHTAIHRWAQATDCNAADIVASVMSFALFRSSVESQAAGLRESWRRAYRNSLANFRSHQSILPVGLDIALRLSELETMPLYSTDTETGDPIPLGTIGRLVLATALEEHLQLIDARKPYHAAIESAHGLSFHDPYA